MWKSSKSARNKNNTNKSQPTLDFFNLKNEIFFHNEKTSLESLSDLIKLNQEIFFSSKNNINDSDFIIYSLNNLKHSLTNSLKKQQTQKQQVLKNVNIYFYNFQKNFFRMKIKNLNIQKLHLFKI